MALNLNIPPDQSTDANFLYGSLGSFWTQIFSENGTLKGYTLGQSQELVQAYQNLAEAIYSFAVNDTPVFHREIWQPLCIKKSQLNQSPFLFEPNGAVFGPQPASDPLYSGVTFQFGFPKSTTQFVYAVTPPFTIGSFSYIANRIFNPSNYYVANVDVSLQNGVLYFNQNPFNNPANTVTNVIGNNGAPVTYVDKNGVTQNEQLLILWLYNVGLNDENNLYNSFGYVFDINLPSSEEYKNILKGFFSISAGGANILAIKNLLAYIGGIVPVIEPSETVQYVAATEYNQVVVTNANSYFFDLDAQLLSTVVPGAVFNAGDTFTNLFAYFDSVTQKSWWKTVFPANLPVPFASYLFLGNYQYQLLFPNSLQLITLSSTGVLNFPVEGTPGDVQILQDYINQPSNKAGIIAALGLTSTADPGTNFLAYPINPVDFIFENFLQNNTAVFVLNFTSPDQTATFLNLFDEVKQYLPKHVYFMTCITTNVGTDVFDNLNNVDNTGYSSDGSNAQGAVGGSPYGSLSIAISPLAGGQPLTNSPNLQVARGNSWWGNSGTCSFKAGQVFTPIPSGATTSTIRTLKIIDLS